MQVIVEKFELRAKNSDFLLLSFFFNAYGIEPLQKSAEGMFRSLLHQLLEQVPPALARFQRLYDHRKLTESEDFEWHKSELSRFLTAALEEIAQEKKITIFIDAIDEAVQGSAEEIINYLHRLDKRLRLIRSDTSACFSCRHYPIIAATEKHEIIVEVENQVDIATYVSTELAVRPLKNREKLEKSGMLATLQREILERSSGVFLWVSLVIPNIIKLLNAGTSPNMVLKALDQAPTPLGEIYADILRNVIREDDRFDALTLMKWASMTEAPLLLSKLCVEVVFSNAGNLPEASIAFEIGEEDVLEMRVGNYSGGLLEVKRPDNRGNVFFIHSTVKVFLIQEGLRLLRRLIRAHLTTNSNITPNNLPLRNSQQSIIPSEIEGLFLDGLTSFKGIQRESLMLTKYRRPSSRR
jgi:hypothetical protein